MFIFAAEMMPEVVMALKVKNHIYVTECTGFSGLSSPHDFQVDLVEAGILSIILPWGHTCEEWFQLLFDQNDVASS